MQNFKENRNFFEKNGKFMCNKIQKNKFYFFQVEIG